MSKILETSPEGRRCKFPGCRRLLSIYNHYEWCRIHQETAAFKQMHKPKKQAERS